MAYIHEDELAYYGDLERAWGALEYALNNCRCGGWCSHRYETRRIVNEVAAQIAAHKAQAAVALVGPSARLRLAEGR